MIKGSREISGGLKFFFLESNNFSVYIVNVFVCACICVFRLCMCVCVCLFIFSNHVFTLTESDLMQFYLCKKRIRRTVFTVMS